jgi:hypothetical protein
MSKTTDLFAASGLRGDVERSLLISQSNRCRLYRRPVGAFTSTVARHLLFPGR